MKCPKCGYTSFESYDSCRKCAADLVGFKEANRITPLVLPASERAALAATMLAEQGQSDAEADNDDMFSFNLPTSQTEESAASTDPFAFNDSPSPATPFSFDTPAVAPAAPAGNDPFASLLESSPAPQQPAAPVAQGLELNSFSWDDTPAPGQPAGDTAPRTAPDDDFNSLFGELGGNKK